MVIQEPNKWKMKTKLELEGESYNDKMWAEYSDAMKEYHKEESRWNSRVLKAIGNQLGKQFLDDVVECFEESEAEGKLELVHKTTGNWQDEHYDSFTGVWIDQWGVGDSGDSWNGYVYIQLKKGLWLKTFYSM